MPRGKRLCLLLCGLAAVGPGAAPAPAAADGWLPSVDVSPVLQNAEPWDVSMQDVAVDARGDAVAVWAPAAGGVLAATRAVSTRPQRSRGRTSPCPPESSRWVFGTGMYLVW